MASPQVPVDDVVEPLETIVRRGFSEYDVFRDWTELMLAALQDDDETYLDILEEYDRGADRDRGNRNADLFAEAFGELQRAMQETNLDALGAVYEALGLSQHDQGIHFTPHNVARAMAEIQVVCQSGESAPEPPVRVVDPACGSGRLLILAARAHDKAVFCYAKDKNSVCARMAALNCCFFNLDAVIVQGDSLTVARQRAWKTMHSPLGGEIAEVSPDALPDPDVLFSGDSDNAEAAETASAESTDIGAVSDDGVPAAANAHAAETDGGSERTDDRRRPADERLTVESSHESEQAGLDEF